MTRTQLMDLVNAAAICLLAVVSLFAKSIPGLLFCLVLATLTADRGRT